MIAVHAGAGYHDPKREEEYARAMRRACQRGSEVLTSNGCCTLRAVEAAIAVLEDAAVCNAGRGSNLTREGTVECDASAMGGGGSFGAVGAAPGIRNPIKAAVQLALDGRERLSCGRVRPMLLAGQGATRWAISRGLDATMNEREADAMHVTPEARQRWKRYRRMVGQAGGEDDRPAESWERLSQKKRQRLGQIYDTVGCVVIDGEGRVAAGASSGGIAFKFSGRVGEAAAYGAGCWAQEDTNIGVGVSVSGVGERIMRHFVAEKCAVAEMEARSCSRVGGGMCTAVSAASAKNCLSTRVDYVDYPQDIGVLCAVRWNESCSTKASDEGKKKVHVQLKACTSGATRSMAVGWLTCGEGGTAINTRILRNDGDDEKAMEWSLIDDVAWEVSRVHGEKASSED